ncbi:30S ribosomal protein S3 [Candidatus Berkelbacteria bacterium]|nr:30S ribosomal protein S3 [Candidatus Berkelbacteria bacterium]
MSHKTNPISNRLPLTKQWRSRWFAEHMIAYNVVEDAEIRRVIGTLYGKNAAIERVEIERSAQEIRVIISTAKPGVVIGRGGQGVQAMRGLLERKLQSFRDKNLRHYVRSGSEQKKALPTGLKLEIVEIKAPELHAMLVAQNIAQQLENRIAFRRAIRQAVEKTMQRGAQGIKVTVSGRLGGSDIARTEKAVQGTVPLSTLRNDIDYGHVDAQVVGFGTIGVRVWVYRGDKLSETLRPQGRRAL